MNKFINSPYKEIPDELVDLYTMNGKIPVFDWYLDGSHPNGVKWSDDLILEYKKIFTPKNLREIKTKEFYKQNNIQSYGHWPAACLLDSFEKYDIKNKNVAVVGSETPWLEAILLNLNNKITTIEYNVPESNFNDLECKDYFNFFEKNKIPFDSIITYSSIEHSGLGRYGDPLDPDGDIRTMRTIHNNLKDDGILIWGAPVGKDALAWNAHRVYGKIRLPLLFNGFEEIEWINTDKNYLFEQPLKKNAINPVVVLKKTVIQ